MCVFCIFTSSFSFYAACKAWHLFAPFTPFERKERKESFMGAPHEAPHKMPNRATEKRVSELSPPTRYDRVEVKEKPPILLSTAE